MTNLRFIICACLIFLKSTAGEPTELIFLRDGVDIEFRLITATSFQKDILRVYVLDTLLIVQGMVSIKLEMPSDKGRGLIQLGKKLCSLRDPLIEKDGELSVMVNSRFEGVKKDLWVEQKDVKKTEEISAVIEYLRKVETETGIKDNRLVGAAEDIFRRAQRTTQKNGSVQRQELDRP